MRKALAFSAAVIALVAFTMSPAPVFGDTANLSVSSPATVSEGSSFTVDVNISGVTDLYDYQFDLAFNPGILSATSVLEGGFLTSGGSTFFVPGTIDNVGGTIAFNADTLLGMISGVSGSGTLLVFDFTATAPGVSDFTVENVTLQDSTGDILDDTAIGGSVVVEGTSAAPEPSVFTILMLGLTACLLPAIKKNRGVTSPFLAPVWAVGPRTLSDTATVCSTK